MSSLVDLAIQAAELGAQPQIGWVNPKLYDELRLLPARRDRQDRRRQRMARKKRRGW